MKSIQKIKYERDLKLERLKSRPMDPMPRKRLQKQIKATAQRKIKKIESKQAAKNKAAKKKIREKWNKRITEIKKEKPSNLRTYKIKRAKAAKKNALSKQKQKYATVVQSQKIKLPPLDYIAESKRYTPQPRRLIDNGTDIFVEPVGSDYIATFQYWFHVPQRGLDEDQILTDWVRLVSETFLSVEQWNMRFVEWATQAKRDWILDTSKAKQKEMRELQEQLFPGISISRVAAKGRTRQNYVSSVYAPQVAGPGEARDKYIFLVLNLMTEKDITIFKYKFVSIGRALVSFR